MATDSWRYCLPLLSASSNGDTDRLNDTWIKSTDKAVVLKVVAHTWQIERYSYVVLIEQQFWSDAR